MSSRLPVRTTAPQGATIREANEFFRRQDFPRATGEFARVLYHWPAMTRTLGGSLGMARDAYLRSRQPEAPLRVGVAGWDLAHNAAGRAHTLAAIYRRFAEPEIIGPLFATNGREVWEPVRHTGLAFHHFVVEDEGAFLDQAVDLVAAHPYDLVHLSKPRFPNIVLGLLYKLIWRSRVLVDIDDEELSFVGATESLPLENYLRQHGELPPVQNLAGPLWTRLAVGLADAFDGVTVSNHVLQARYGGTIIPHARDERVFQPSPALRSQGRAKLGIPPDHKVVLFLGTPADYKGLPLVARAVGQLGRDDVTFLLAGGLFDETLQAELQKLSGDRCRFTGYEPFDQIPATIAAAECCCFLQDPTHPVSRFQMPAKLSDALALGVPCLVSPSLVLQEACDHQACLPVDEAALVPQLRRLLDDRNHAAAQSQSARAFFRLRLAADQAGQTLQSLAQPPACDPQALATHPRLAPCLAHLNLAAFLPSLNAFPPSVNGQEAAREINGHTSPAVVETTTTEVDVIVPVHDALPDVKECLRSLGAHTDGFNVRIIVIDDASSPATRDWLHEFCAADPRFHLVTHPHNRGYTCSVNTGLKLSEAAYVVIQNSDTIVTPGWLSSLVRCIESDPAIGLAGPLSNAASWQNVPELRDKDGNFAINALPDGLGPADMAALVAHCSARSYPRVPFLNGFSYMIKKEVIGKIGLMDEASFPQGYGEENDFCLRAADAGYQLAVADDAFVFHAKSKSFGHERRIKLCEQANQALARKHSQSRIDELITLLKRDAALSDIRRRVASGKPDIPAPPRPATKEELAIRALFIVPVFGVGGGIHSVVQEVAAMRSLGAESRIGILPAHRPQFLELYREMREVEDLFVDMDLSNPAAAAAGFDVVVATHYSSVKIVRAIVADQPHIMAAYYIQDYEPFFFQEGDPRLRMSLESYSLIPGMFCFAKTAWLVRTLREKHGLSVYKVEPSLDHEVYHPRARAVQQRIRITAMVRPESPRRGAERTMRILRELSIRHGDKVEIHIFGCDDEALRGLVGDFTCKNHGLLNRTAVAELLAESDLFTDFSDYQAFGRTALEAMACGCPAVVPQQGGCDEFARDGRNSLMVDTRDEVSCVERISTLLAQPAQLEAMAKEALGTASRYSPKAAALSELGVFRRGLEKRTSFPSANSSIKRGVIAPSLRSRTEPAGSGFVRLIYPYSMPRQTPFSWSRFTKLPTPGSAELFLFQRDFPEVHLADFRRWAASWKALGGTLVYDLDDDLLDVEGVMLRTGRSRQAAEELSERIRTFLAAADTVAVSTPGLAGQVGAYCARTIVVPNALDPAIWRLQQRPRPLAAGHERKPGDPLRIGYIGTPSHDSDVLMIKEAVRAISEEYGNRVVFEIIGAFEGRTPPFGRNIALPRKTTYPHFVDWLLQRVNWDIGLIPLAEDRFNTSKSYLKFLEYAGLDLSIICSNHGAYRDVVKTGSNCLAVANSTEAWYAAMKTLIGDAALRERLARNAFEDLIGHHTTAARTADYCSVLAPAR
jgi:GT2 family glycosyltransferase/glycosyltransferase involved in cell wall biosynthesis